MLGGNRREEAGGAGGQGVRGQQRLLVQGCATWQGRGLGDVVLGEAGLVDICLLSPPFSCERGDVPWAGAAICPGSPIVLRPLQGRGASCGQRSWGRTRPTEGSFQGWWHRGRALPVGLGGQQLSSGPPSPSPLLEHQDRRTGAFPCWSHLLLDVSEDGWPRSCQAD